MPGSEEGGLTIGELSSRTGVPVGTLRMWESRYGFPTPERLPSGHRRYDVRDVERVQAVLRSRRAGLPLAHAVQRAQRLLDGPPPSVFGVLRERFPHLHPQLLSKPLMVGLSRALEDECFARAPRPLLFGCFQHERFYRRSQARWRELARTAEHAAVLAEFSRGDALDAAPPEVALAPGDPLRREWVVVCEAEPFSACLAGWERPGPGRRFEAIWTVEPQVVREAARICCQLVSRTVPELMRGVRERLAEPAAPADGERVQAALALAARALAYAQDGAIG